MARFVVHEGKLFRISTHNCHPLPSMLLSTDVIFPTLRYIFLYYWMYIASKELPEPQQVILY